MKDFRKRLICVAALAFVVVLVAAHLCAAVLPAPNQDAHQPQKPRVPPEPASNQVPPDTVIVLQREACERRCSVYRLVIFADGEVVWDGIAYVSTMGTARGRIDPSAIKEWLEEERAMKFFDLKNGYGVLQKFGMSSNLEVSEEKCNSEDPDAPLAMLSISTGGLRKQ